MKFKYGSIYGFKEIEVSQYTTKQEKAILVMLMQDVEHVNFDILDEALLIIGYDKETIANFTRYEKRIILLKCRELSLGDDISFNFTCNKCHAVNNTLAKVDDFFTNKINVDHKPKKYPNFSIVEQYNDLTDKSIDIEDYLRIHDGSKVSTDIIDNMDAIEFEDIYDEIETKTIKFKSNIIGYCQCGNHVPINLSDNFIVENMSEDTIQSIYKTYSDLIYFGKYSKQDIDTLIPFERTIFVGMLNNTRKETSGQ